MAGLESMEATGAFVSVCVLVALCTCISVASQVLCTQLYGLSLLSTACNHCVHSQHAFTACINGCASA